MGKVLGPPATGDTETEALQKLLSGYQRARDEGLAPINPALEEILSARSSEEFLEDQSIHVPGLTNSRENLKSREITPEPFYFVKTCDMEGKKVFINMCGSSEVAAPGHWQDGVPPELDKSFSLMESKAEGGIQNLRFSLSCSDYILSVDKQGNPCKVFDVVFNLVVMRHSKVHTQLRTFLINMAMTWINQKYNVELQPDFKLPKGKYKGDIVQKHHIRAAKAHLITEITDQDAELQPSFPLLVDAASQPSSSQEIKMLQNKHILGKLNDLPESNVITQDSTTEASNVTEAKASVSSLEEVFKPKLNVMEDQVCQETLTASSEKERACDRRTNQTSKFQGVENMKKDDTDIEQEVCTSASVASSEGTEIADEPSPHTPSQDMAMKNAGLLVKNTPFIQVKYLGYPVELVIMCLSFPSCKLKVQDIQVWTSNTTLYVEANSYKPVMVPLVFPTTPQEAKAAFFNFESLLEIYLPFSTYVELLA